MPRVFMKSGEVREVPDEEMLSFLQENRDLIQNCHSARQRRIKKSESSESCFTSKQ
jgi:hypothetical protein